MTRGVCDAGIGRSTTSSLIPDTADESVAAAAGRAGVSKVEPLLSTNFGGGAEVEDEEEEDEDGGVDEGEAKSDDSLLRNTDDGESGTLNIGDGGLLPGRSCGEAGIEEDEDQVPKSGNSLLSITIVKPGVTTAVCDVTDGRSFLGATENESESGSSKSCVSLPRETGDDDGPGTSCGEGGTEDESKNESGESDNWLPLRTGDKPKEAMKPLFGPGLCDVGDWGSLLRENGDGDDDDEPGGGAKCSVGGRVWDCHTGFREFSSVGTTRDGHGDTDCERDGILGGGDDSGGV